MHEHWLTISSLSQNVCGMAVVGNDYESLKRYNLLEIYDAAQATNEPER
jgi:hypothetical protein